MICQVCIDRPCSYGNSVLCPCCGEIICGHCSLEVFLHNNGKLKCPICRGAHNLSLDILVDKLEKTCQREEDNYDAKVCLSGQYFTGGRYARSRNLLESLGNQIHDFKGGYYYLAILYRYGLGGEKRSNKAFKMFLDLSNVGRSLRFLGEMFIDGEGVDMNKEYGMSLIRICEKRPDFPVHYRTGRNMLI
jgi:hypothetical protein